MAYLRIAREVADDLKSIKESGEISADKAAVQIAALLREASEDPRLADEFLEPGTHVTSASNLDYNVDQFRELQKLGLDIWRLKILDLERVGLKYRILCGHFEVSETIVVLAVAHRSFDYAISHPVTQRVADAYKRLRDSGWR